MFHYLCTVNKIIWYIWYEGNNSNSQIGLASLMARSHNTIATYLKQLTRDEELVELTDNMPI